MLALLLGRVLLRMPPSAEPLLGPKHQRTMPTRGSDGASIQGTRGQLTTGANEARRVGRALVESIVNDGADTDLAAFQRALSARAEVDAGCAEWTEAAIAEQLGVEVLAQDQAIATVSRVLALPMARLAFDRCRPQAVFAFVGSTGCGKTELGRALRHITLRSQLRTVIRLDMTEYADETARHRLTGSNPGYVGFEDTSTLLTSQIRTHPDAVLILDEFEKAHSNVHALFLQVFDRGALTDGHGRIARFDKSIIVLTSNVGAATAARPPVGFRTGGPNGDDRRATFLEEFARLVPAEFIGRLDEVVVFADLDDDALRSIVEHHLNRWFEQVRPDGWALSATSAVADLVVSQTDRRYGARRVLRLIEQLVIRGLVGRSPGGFDADVIDGVVVWHEVA